MQTSAILSRLTKIKSMPILSRLSPGSTHAPTQAELAGFKRAQDLAYECATEAALALREGWTEKRITQWMEAFLADHGVKSYFHRPLAWYGERTRFKGFRAASDAMPSGRRLKAGEVVVLDLAPIVGGYVGDIGFTFSLQPNDKLASARSYMLKLREELVGMFSSSMNPAAIWKAVDASVKGAGYENCYRKYQFQVLGHRVHKLPLDWIPSTAGVYSLHGYWALISRGLYPELLSPWHEGEKIGLWAIEPHIGIDREFGFKFEEVLVVEADKAYWIDDDVPHLKLPKGLY